MRGYDHQWGFRVWDMVEGDKIIIIENISSSSYVKVNKWGDILTIERADLTYKFVQLTNGLTDEAAAQAMHDSPGNTGS